MTEKISAYDMFKQRLPKEQYFDKWEEDKLLGLTEDLKDRIYHRYKVKCNVFHRDGFKCRNLDCTSPHSGITLHHIKWQKNGGNDTEDNCVTLCDACHKGYHAATVTLRFGKEKSLPKKIRKQVMRLEKSDEVDWKEIKKKMRKFRKNLMPTLQHLDDEDIYAMLKMFFDEMFKYER